MRIKGKNIGYDIRMPEDAVIYDQACPILHALQLIGGKWKLPILWYLAVQPAVRYNELKRKVRGVTNMMLTKCLRELEENGLVERIDYQEVPPRVEYALTEQGRSLLPALKSLYAWGERQLAESSKLSGR